MITAIHFKEWLSWRSVRAHVCTLVVTLSFNSTWRVPRQAARFGGLQYALALSTALVVVAFPLALLQLAVGQLSQQDAVGLWRAVPLFKGVGYLRLVVSFLGSIYASIYLALTISIFLYTLRNSIPFIECTEPNLITSSADENINALNETNCLDFTFMAPVKENPEYFVAMCSIIIFLWISLPFLLYSPVRLIKRVFYVCGPVVIILSIVVVSGMGDGGRLQWMAQHADWASFTEPHIWFAAVTQALLTTEVAGGYLVSAGDSIYSSNDVRWTAVVLVVISIIVNWIGLVFWYSIGGASDMDSGAAAVLTQIYGAAVESDLSIVWPLFAFAALFSSGIITMLVRLYPIYERIRRSGGARWRVVCAGSALVCAGASVGVLAGRWRALDVLEVYAVPMLTAIATVLEVLALVFIYGWKVLMEDVEFLTGDPLNKFWVWGWFAAPVLIVPTWVWWAVIVGREGWQQPPWPPAVLVATAALVALVLVVAGATAIARQVQYDVIGKLRSSLKPSRHWGPRDPITHYYWLARREGTQGGEQTTNYRRRHLGEMSGNIISKPYLPVKYVNSSEQKKRSNSDDWIYTIYRKKYLKEIFPDYFAPKKCRSKSVDWDRIPNLVQQVRMQSSVYMTALHSLESVTEGSRTVVSDEVKTSKC